MAAITPDYVRMYVRDHVEYNKLLDELQFSDERISQCKELAIDHFNLYTPISSYTEANFPSKTLLLLGILWHLFLGESAAAARNELTYSDGGLTVPLEERFQYYNNLAQTYGQQFTTSSQQVKIQLNLDDGYGMVGSDFAWLPIY